MFEYFITKNTNLINPYVFNNTNLLFEKFL